MASKDSIRFTVEVGDYTFEEKDGIVSDLSVDMTTDGADRFELTLQPRFDNESRTFPGISPGDFDQGFWDMATEDLLGTSGAKDVRIDLGYAYTGTENVFEGKLHQVDVDFSMSGPPSISLSGYSNTYALTMGTEERTWKRTPISVIVAMVVAEYVSEGVTFQTDPSTLLMPKKTIQNNENDYQFLEGLAEKYGYKFYTSQNTVFFKSPSLNLDHVFDEITDYVFEMLSTASETVGLGDELGGVMSEAQSGINEAQDAVSEGMNTAQQELQDARSEVSEGVSDVTSTVASGAEGLSEDLSEEMGGVEVIESMGDVAAEQVDNIGDFAKDLTGSAMKIPGMNETVEVGHWELESFNGGFDAAQLVDKVKVIHWDDETRKLIKSKASLPGLLGDDGVTKKYRIPVPSKLAAKLMAMAKLLQHKTGIGYARGEMKGNPSVRVGKDMDVAGFGKELSHEYVIAEATHRVSVSDGYTTEFELKEML